MVVYDTLSLRTPLSSQLARRRSLAAQPSTGRSSSRPEARDIPAGSPTTSNPLLALGLVDGLHVLVGPGGIGFGLPAFAPAVRRRVTLREQVACLWQDPGVPVVIAPPYGHTRLLGDGNPLVPSGHLSECT